MLIAARNGFLVGGGWKNPYVTDGLIAMWDGEWNAGGGVHDPSATVWKDLSSSGNDINILQSSDWSWENGLKFERLGQNCAVSLYDTPFLTAETVISGDPSTTQNLKMVWQRKAQSEGADNNSLWFFVGNTQAVGVSGVNRSQTYSFPLDENTNRFFFRGTICAQYTSIQNSLPISCFINAAQATLASYTDYWVSPSDYKFHLGYANNNNYPFKGTIHCIRLYSRYITAAEVAANYAIDKARFNLP